MAVPTQGADLEHHVVEALKLLPALMRSLDRRTPNHARKLGASAAQMRAIVHLAEYGPQTMGELARGLAITTPSATGLVGPLVEKGFLQRERDVTDRRVVRVDLTPSARVEAERLLAERREEMATALVGMSEQERAHFVEGLRRLTDVYESRARRARGA